MSGRIPQQFIDNLLARTDIVELIGSRVDLKKAGRSYKGLCPFHEEKTPSFNVSPDRQLYHCFGCGAGGSAIGFLLEYDNLEFQAAVTELAHMAGMKVPENQNYNQELQQAQQQVLAQLETAQHFYRRQLRASSHRQEAIQYLKKRGLTGEIANTYGIGYAPPGWDNLRKAMAQNSAQEKQMVNAGLLIESDSGKHSYDRFRDRIIFPIRNTRGHTIAFGGRVLGDDKPKYLNSPETVVFHKGQELYGLYEARQANKQLKQLVIVEGYMDVVALAQQGVTNAVATLGTATNQEHLSKLFHYVTTIIFCFDGDAAGKKAAIRALDISIPAMKDGRQISFTFLEEGEDPDSTIQKHGRVFFEELLKRSVPLADFFFDQLKEQHNVNSIDGKACLSKQALPMINKIPRGVFKQLMLQQLAELTGVNAETLVTYGPSENVPPIESYQDAYTQSTYTPQKATPIFKKTYSSATESLSRKIIRLLLHDPCLVSTITFEYKWEFLHDRETILLQEIIEIIKNEVDITSINLNIQLQKHAACHELTHLASMEQLLPDLASKERELHSILNQLTAANVRAHIECLHCKMQSNSATQAEQEMFLKLLAENKTSIN